MFPNWFGNQEAAGTLLQMAKCGRIPQTLLLAGPEGVGKATLARRFAAVLLGDPAKIERDDQSLPENVAAIADREKLPAEKRNDDPLVFASHPDFLTFAPDGPLRQISIPQMRLLKERSQFKPLKGKHRVFLIDRLDRANEQAANSLLKTLEEPPEHLVIIATAENVYDLLPTIRSRAVMFHLSQLSNEDMEQFLATRALKDAQRRAALAAGSPGVAVSLDLELYDKRRAAMLKLLEAGSGRVPFADWSRVSESVASSRSEKLEGYLKVLYGLLEDVVLLHHGASGARNTDRLKELEPIARSVNFAWISLAVKRTDELSELVRRNIQKNLALDAMVLALREV